MKYRILALAFAALLAVNASAQEKGYAGTVYMVSNAHLDSQWNWDVQTTINEYIPATLYRNLTLMDKYPDYVFNCESGIKYQWMKEYHPDAFAKLRKYIQEGRWHISGAAWEASDANVPSTEALTRNILLGQMFYEKEFGVLSTDIFLPDCFGFGQHLPTVAAHCGLMGFSSQKLQWRNNPFYGNLKEPFAYGKWTGLDGNSIYVALRTDKYSRRYNGEDLSVNEDVIAKVAKYPNHIAMMYYGVGDVGGSPTLPSVQSVVKGVNGEGPLKVVSAASDDLFKYLKDNNVDVESFNGELLMDVHGTGCYTSQAAMKLFNRRNELLADAAERSSVAAELLAGLEYPATQFDEIWRRFIWHQFHDDLTGTSIPRAYEFSWNDEIISLLQSSAIENSAVGAVSSMLDTKVSGSQKPLVLYNPSAFDRQDVVSIDGFWKIYDSKGKAVEVQHFEGKTVFVASVPATGYAVYGAKTSKEIKAKTSKISTLEYKPVEVSNSVYTLSFDRNGDLCSIVDRRSGREIVEKGKAVRLAVIDNNRSHRWPAWEITKESLDQESHAITKNVCCNLVENGPVRKTVKIEKTYGESKFVQYVHLYEGEDADRIDFETEVDWNSMATLLKAEFPLSFSAKNARYDIGTGSLLRGNNTLTKYEVYAQQWADMTADDGSYGLSILNDCKYGWDKPADNLLRLTLLHTPETRQFYPYQDHQDLGHHKFTYSIVGHEGDWNEAGTVAKAEEINHPVRAFFTTRHAGKLGRSWSLVGAEGASLRAVKKAEDGDGYVVRLYETTGKGSDASLKFAFPVSSVEELNGIEKPIENVDSPAIVAGNTVKAKMTPFGIRTIRVRFGAQSPAEFMAQQPLKLTYSARTATYNAFREDGSMDIEGRSYPAEQIPSVITHRGVNFPMADVAELNAVKCAGQELTLPEGKWNKVYLLASASRNDVIATFKAGTSTQDVLVPYYSDFVGQWGHKDHTEGFIKDADVALVCTHRHSGKENKDLAYEFAYMFCIGLDIPAGAVSITLPENKQVVVFSAVAVNDTDKTVSAAADPLRVSVPVTSKAERLEETICLTDGNVCGKSGEHNDSEAAILLLDDDVNTKWCDNGNAEQKYVEFDLKRSREIKGWYVLHATKETPSYTTKNFCLQIRNSEDEEWKTVDAVKDNTDEVTSRDLEHPVTARYVRLFITAAHQIATDNGDCGTSRIYEFSLR